MTAEVIVRVLGSVSVIDREGRGVTGPAKQSCVLAALALTPRQPVTLGTLISTVWNHDPPVSASNVLYGHITRLRHLLDGRAAIRHSRDEGYVLDIDPHQIDLHAARALASKANSVADSGDSHRAVQLWRQACHWWAESPLLGVDGSWARATRESLRREQVSVYSGRFAMELALGQHAMVARELESLLNQHSTAEELVAQHMLALYRCGRAAEALDCYEDVRTRLRDRLGTAPARQLRELHRQILRHDTDLLWSGAGETESAKPPKVDTPAQLPADITSFTGREAPLAALLAHPSDDRAKVTIVDGMAGVGKTALVVHAAHRMAPEFPDGQLFLDLHGHTESTSPIEPADALDRLLRACGTPSHSIPDAVEDRAAMFRGLMADKRMLLILDNAADHRQVRPLLSAGAGNRVLITSRRALSEIDDAVTVNLDTLTASEAARLFCRAARLAEPNGGTSETVDSVVEVCGHLPLALRIAAARLTSRKNWTTEELRDRLLAAADPLRQLGSGQRTVIAAFDVSFQQLDAEAKRAFGLLGMAPGPDFGVHAAAALLDRDIDTTEELLERLVDNNLLRLGSGGRFSFHDLMGQYALRASRTGQSEAERAAATRRVIDMYCAAATEACRQSDMMMFQTPSAAPANAHAFPRIPDAAAAISWWHREWRNVVAALVLAIERQLESQAFLAVTTLWSYLNLLEDIDRMVAVSRQALQAARPHAGSVLESWTLTFHGLALFHVGRLPQALWHLDRSLEIRRAHGDVEGQAMLRHNIGLVLKAMGSFESALSAFSQAHDDFAEVNSHLNMMSSLFERALVYTRLGYPEAARRDMTTADEWLLENGKEAERAWSRIHNGLIYLEHGDHATALREFEAADEPDNADPEYQVTRQLGIARAEHGAGQLDAALPRCEEVLEWCLSRERRCEPEVRNVLGAMLYGAGRVDDSAAQFGDAVKVAESSGAGYELARAHHGLAQVHTARGDRVAAQRHLVTAYDHYSACGAVEAPAVRAQLDGPT